MRRAFAWGLWIGVVLAAASAGGAVAQEPKAAEPAPPAEGTVELPKMTVETSVKMLFFDAATGEPQGGRVPWEGTAADIFMQLQFPLHSGRIAGIPGRVFLSFMGLVVALLSATGIIIWFKKRAGRKVLARVEQSRVPRFAR